MVALLVGIKLFPLSSMALVLALADVKFRISLPAGIFWYSAALALDDEGPDSDRGTADGRIRCL